MPLLFRTQIQGSMRPADSHSSERHSLPFPTDVRSPPARALRSCTAISTELPRAGDGRSGRDLGAGLAVILGTASGVKGDERTSSPQGAGEPLTKKLRSDSPAV